MSQEHTPEPWSIGDSKLSVIQKEKALIVAYVGSRDELSNEELEANAERIVSCVNAMEGIEDPQLLRDHYEMAEVTIDALRSHDKRIRQLIKADENESTFDEVARMKDRFIAMLRHVQKEFPRMENIGKLISEYE